MAYFDTNLISRKSYGGRPMSGLGGVLDDVGSAISSVIGTYGKVEQQAGANATLNAQSQALLTQQAAAASSGPSLTTLLLLGGVGFGAYMLLKPKK